MKKREFIKKLKFELTIINDKIIHMPTTILTFNKHEIINMYSKNIVSKKYYFTINIEEK